MERCSVGRWADMETRRIMHVRLSILVDMEGRKAGMGREGWKSNLRKGKEKKKEDKKEKE